MMKIFVPGRICLFGEHTDWAGGHRRTNADLERVTQLSLVPIKGFMPKSILTPPN